MFKKDMEKFARQTGILLLREFRKRKTMRREHGKDIKTFYDKISDHLIKISIEKKYPTHSILTEETGYIEKDPNYLWIVDPLDGTSNFINSNPFFSVSIALLRGGEITLGVIYAPFLKEMFTAEKGKGAFLNGNAIHVSNIDKIEKSYIVTCEGGEKNRKRTAEIYKRLTQKTLDIRKLGSGALECAWVACGRSDGYVTTKISSWDVAAGILLVKEAGGEVSDFKGRRWDYKQTPDLIVSNGKIHKQIMRIVKDV